MHFSVLKIHDLPCTGNRRINPMEIAALLKANHRVNTIPIKIPMIFFPGETNKQNKPYNSYGNTKVPNYTTEPW